MAENIGGVYYELDLKGKGQFEKDVDSASSKMGNLRGAFEKLRGVAETVVKTMAGVGVAVLGITGQAVNVAGKFESMGVSLEVAFQGNKKQAQEAQKQITEFATKTPYQLEEVLNSFIKLKNYGLNPSQEALTAYGDTASAMGKSLDQMIEAVADASSGEFERLKEFGIKASKEKNKVTFTFRGVKTTVKNDSKAIEGYLIGLGKTNFGGGMAKQSETFQGIMSNLKDTIELTMGDIVTQTGIFDFVKQNISSLVNWLGANKGKFITFFKDLKSAFKGFYDVVFGVGKLADDGVLGDLGDQLYALFGLDLAQVFYDIRDALDATRAKISELKNAMVLLWSMIAPTLLPALQFLADTVTTMLLPALQRLWTVLAPILIPLLKTLAVIFAVVLYSAIVAAIYILGTIVGVVSWVADTFVWFIKTTDWAWGQFSKNLSWIAGVVGSIFGWIADRIRDLGNWFWSIPGTISSALNGVYWAIMTPFNHVFDRLKQGLADIKWWLNNALNPFVRHSPSLVDWVHKGAGEIEDTYNDMFNRLGNISAQNRISMTGAVKSVAGMNEEKGNIGGSVVNNFTIAPQGIIARSDGELRDIAVRIVEVAKQASETTGQKVNITRT